MPRFTKTWEIDWKGRQIRIENWWDLLLRTGERMFVDGTLVAEHAGWLGLGSDLETQIDDGGTLRTIRAHLGSIDFGLRLGCTVYVDDKAIGGDANKRFVT